MDNICHTLVGLALGEAGLKRKTALGNATLMVAANVPDLDVAAYLWSPVTALGFRRGWTHGVPAVAVWPLVVAGLMLALDRLQRRWRPHDPPARARGLVLLAAAGVATHPLLDWLNTYGVRWLMPFSGRWHYGDALFIVDPWVWLALMVGAWLSARSWRRGGARAGWPARVALAAVAVYGAAMAALGARAREALVGDLASRGVAVRAPMAAPVPASPLRRRLVARLHEGRYVLGELRWRPDPVIRWDDDLPAGDTTALARVAAATADGRAFLRWARFPFYRIGPTADCTSGHVCIFDARYYPQGWASVAIPVERSLSLRRTLTAELP